MKYDYKYCYDLGELHDFLKECNEKGYEIITMIEKHGYTIIYKKGEVIKC